MASLDDKTVQILEGASRLAESGKEGSARAYLAEQMQYLPQDVQDALAIEALFGAVSKGAREIEMAKKAKEEGVLGAALSEQASGGGAVD